MTVRFKNLGGMAPSPPWLRLCTTWTCQNVFAADWQSCLWLASCWNIPSVLCPLLPPPLTSCIQNLRRFWECCIWKAHLETVIFRMLASRLKFNCHIRGLTARPGDFCIALLQLRKQSLAKRLRESS